MPEPVAPPNGDKKKEQSKITPSIKQQSKITPSTKPQANEDNEAEQDM